MTDDPDALAVLLSARDATRDLCDGVAAVVERARALCDETGWRAPSAAAFHRSAEAWTGDLADLRALLADLEDQAAAAAHRVQWRLDHAFAAVGS